MATTKPAEVSLPSDTEVRVTRDFRAPRTLVWRAHTEPNLIRRWMGYPGWSMPVCDMDVRPGGKYHWRWRQDESGQGFAFIGTFREVEAPAKLSYDQNYVPDGFDSAMPENIPTVIRSTYAETNGVTTLVTLMDFGSKEARDAAISTGMTDGMETSYGRLDALFADQRGD